MLEETGERYLPWFEDASTSYEHLHRYAYASQYVENKRVLDLASGEGYGSHLLSQAAKLVMGIDLDEAVISHANHKYRNHNLQFKVGSITEVPIEGKNIFDVIICYEAIEHIEDYEKCLTEVKRLLTPEGMFIVSTPDKGVYSDEPQFKNPFHVHEFYFDEFRKLLEKHFRNLQFLGQRIYSGSNIWPLSVQDNANHAEYVIGRVSKEFSFVEVNRKVPRYFIAVASNADHEVDLKTSTLLDITAELDKQMDQLQKKSKAKERELVALKEELNRIHSTLIWRVLAKLRRITGKLI